jgi:hypothetical protein
LRSEETVRIIDIEKFVIKYSSAKMMKKFMGYLFLFLATSAILFIGISAGVEQNAPTGAQRYLAACHASVTMQMQTKGCRQDHFVYWAAGFHHWPRVAQYCKDGSIHRFYDHVLYWTCTTK